MAAFLMPIPDMGGNTMADDDTGTSTDTGADDAGQQQDGKSTDQSQQTDRTATGTGSDADNQQDSKGDDSDKDKEPDWKAEVAKWKALARKHEARVKELSPAAVKLKEIEDSQKSELEKAQERETALQVELQKYRVAEVRRAAASAAGLDPELAEFITAVDEEEAKAQAEKLAERFKTSAANSKSADFKQGTRTTAPVARSRDDLLRTLAGYGPR
jgi:hypothetical protein